MAAAVYTADRGIERYFLDVFGNFEAMHRHREEIISKFVSIFDITTDASKLVLKKPISGRFTLIDNEVHRKYVVQLNLTHVGPRILCSFSTCLNGFDTDSTVESDSTFFVSDSEDEDMDF